MHGLSEWHPPLADGTWPTDPADALRCPVIGWMMDPQARITEISAEVRAIFGWAREDLLGRFADSFIAYTDRQRATDVMFACAAADRDWVDEPFGYITKGGDIIPMLSSGARLSDDHGAFLGFEGSLRPAPDAFV